jgi:hypothetical protein
MSPGLQTKAFQNDWSVGEVYDVAPALISAAGASRMADVLLDEDGSPYRRGGTAYKSKEGLGAAGLRWGWDGYLLPGARTLVANESDFGVLASDDESFVNVGGAGLAFPKQSAVLQDLLYIGGGTLYGGSRKAAVYSTGTVTVTNGSKTVTGSGTTWNTLVDAGMLLHLGTERIYVVASVDSTTQITLRDAYQGGTGGGKSYTLNPVWTVGGSDPYETYDYVTVCSNRFVFASGRKITFTEVNNPHTFTNSLGTTNEHTVPEGVQIVGLATSGQTVLVFTTAGVWTLDGLALDITDLNGNAQHRLQLLSSGIVLAGAAGIAGSGQRLVIPAGDGIYLMDGVSQPVRVSKPIDRLYLQRIADGYRLGGANVYRGHYFLPIITGLGKVPNLLVCRLDRPTRDRGQTLFPWSHFTGDGGEITTFFTRATSDPQQPKLFGCQAREPSRLVDCSGYFDPRAAIKNDADGSTFNLDIITRDYETGSGTINVVRAVKPRYELVDAAEDEPELQVSYSDGSSQAEGFILDESVLDEGELGDESSVAFTPAEGAAGPSDGRTPARLRVNRKARHIRFHITSSGPAARCTLRSLEMTIRPSGAIRR